jgi:hypothetical protein
MLTLGFFLVVLCGLNGFTAEHLNGAHLLWIWFALAS